MELNPKFSLEMQNSLTKKFPCIVKDSIEYIKGKDSMIPFPIIVKKDSIVYTNGKDSVVYKWVFVPGSTIYRVDTIKTNEEDLRRINALTKSLTQSDQDKDKSINEGKVKDVTISSLRFKVWALGIGMSLFIALSGYLFVRKLFPSKLLV